LLGQLLVAELFASGRVVDLILALMAAEGLVLAAYRRSTGRGVATADLVINLLAGAFLLMALRAALTGSAWSWVAGWLAAGLGAHLADLRCRWRA
jgi:hypothetical protein